MFKPKQLMKKSIFYVCCILALGVNTATAQSTQSKKNTEKIASEKVERPYGEVIIIQPTKKKKAKKNNVVAVKKETLIIAEPKKQAKQTK